MKRDSGQAEEESTPAHRPRPLRPAALVILCALGGAILAGALGSVILAAIWIVGAPQGARRALLRASLHGVLIGAAGLGAGGLSGAVAIAQARRLPRRRQAAALGASLGGALGGGLGVLVWDESAGRPVAVASLLANAAAGAVMALFARHLARR
jgi:hypothetical protein